MALRRTPANNAVFPVTLSRLRESQRTSHANHKVLICKFVRALAVHS